MDCERFAWKQRYMSLPVGEPGLGEPEIMYTQDDRAVEDETYKLQGNKTQSFLECHFVAVLVASFGCSWI
jgi:hypothetical protein